MVCRVFVLAFIVLCCASFDARGQQQSAGTLRGTVSDEFGGVIIGATVTVADSSGVERTATTDEEGRYVFSALPPEPSGEDHPARPQEPAALAAAH